MGAVHFSIDLGLVQLLRDQLGLEHFVETGTFQGATLELLLKEFPHLASVELSQELHAAACEKFSAHQNVKLYQGNSAECLKNIKGGLLGKPALYWLDAHWCVADHTSGEVSQCPLIEEIRAIQPVNASDVILIDDARLFLAPPPPPHEISVWPSFDQLLATMEPIKSSHGILVLNDTILLYPRSIEGPVRSYAAKNQVDVLQVFNEARERAQWKKNHDQAKAYAASLEKKTADYMEMCQKLASLQTELDRVEMKIVRRLSRLLRDR
jgi:hypothetical protein